MFRRTDLFRILISLQVNWPKLHTPSHATESYQDTLERVSRDPLLGPLVAKHGRGKSDVRMGYMEEGKKRRE